MRKMIYINLDEAVERREAIESSLRPACEAADLALVRLPATSAKAFADLPPGPLSPAALACWQSHERAIEMCGEVLGPAHVVEDDVYATAQSLGVIDNLLRALPDDSWDILFCDVCIPHPSVMVELFLLYRELRESERFMLVDLKGFNFVAMTSYLVNPPVGRNATFATQESQGRIANRPCRPCGALFDSYGQYQRSSDISVCDDGFDFEWAIAD